MSSARGLLLTTAPGPWAGSFHAGEGESSGQWGAVRDWAGWRGTYESSEPMARGIVIYIFLDGKRWCANRTAGFSKTCRLYLASCLSEAIRCQNT